jgi:hypothetical protein
MKGAVFVCFADMIQARFGLSMWDAIIGATRPASGGAYTSAGNYDDAELFAYVAELSRRVQTPPPDLVRAFGEYLAPAFKKMYPTLFAYASAKDLIQNVDRVVHAEVRKLYPDAAPPTFDCRDTGPKRLEIEYRSNRKLCMLAEGLIVGTATQFNQTAHIEHAQCMHRGADHCLLIVDFSDRLET